MPRIAQECTAPELGIAGSLPGRGAPRHAEPRSGDGHPRGHFHGTSACLSALHRAERHAEIATLLDAETFWPHKRCAVKAFAAMRKRAEAMRLLADLQRIRKDEEIFDDILGWRGRRTAITAVVANLADAADPGTRKALARIRRSIRRIAEL